MGYGSKRLELDDALIKEEISGWRSSPDERKYRRIMEMLSPLIYEYPVRVFNANEDSSGNFFEYVFERLSQLLMKYDAQATRFTTWFFIVLRNLYFNWLRSNRSKEGLRTIPIKIPSQDSETEIDLGDMKEYRTWHEKEQKNSVPDCPDPCQRITKIVQKLPPEHRLLLSVLYGDIDLEALFQNRGTKRTPRDVMERYAAAKAEIHKKNRKTLEKIRLYRKEILDLQNMEMELQNKSRTLPDYRNALEEVRQKIKLKRDYKTKAEVSLGKSYLNIPYDIAAEIMGWSVAKVKKYSNIIKNRIRIEFLKKEKP
jgi:RNA polymerase sigma factor (sigma-70 family)